MSCQQPFCIYFTEFLQIPGVRLYNIPLFRYRDAGGLWLGFTHNIHKTHAAYGMGRQTRIVTERGDIHARFPDRIEQCRGIIQLDRPPINRKFDHGSTCYLRPT
jgi:hypothetical protein